MSIACQWTTSPDASSDGESASLAENIGTFTQVWLYPSQKAGWTMVGLPKLGSWFLLQIVSYALVALVRRPQPPDEAPVLASRARHEKRLAQG